MVDVSKRRFIKRSFMGLGASGIGVAVWSGLLTGGYSAANNLQPADSNGIRLPVGLHSRVIARSSQPVLDGRYVWHAAPDGGACFSTENGGWVYVSNSEMDTSGGVGAVAFDRTGKIIDA